VVTAPRGAGQNGGTDLAQSLLEREAALSQLGALAREVRRGCGRVALLRGEAGVGKTAVIARLPPDWVAPDFYTAGVTR
jgi:flagellar biosynthesis GTPase FlhF